MKVIVNIVERFTMLC